MKTKKHFLFSLLIICLLTLILFSESNAQNIEITKKVITFAGSGTLGKVDGTGSQASFWGASGITTDASGNVYIAEKSNSLIRKITPAGVVTTLAGSTSGFNDGLGSAAKFNQPTDVAVDVQGNVYVLDDGNFRIRKITPTGNVTTFAGTGVAGYQDGEGNVAKFNSLSGIAIDGSGNLYVADLANNRIRKVTSAGVVSTLAGTGVAGYADGAGASAKFYYPGSITVDASGTVYVAERGTHRIRKITSVGTVSTIAGSGTAGSANGTGAAASFNFPNGIAVDANGNLYVSDYYNTKIRKITTAGVVSNFAGTSSGYVDGFTNVARFNFQDGITIDANGNFYISEDTRIRKIINNSFNQFTSVYGASSSSQNFYFEGTDLSSDVTITAPDGFEVSRTTFSSSVTVAPTNGIITSQNISIRLKSLVAAGTYSGSISISSPGATTRYLSVTGEVSKANQTITFASLAQKNMGDGPFALNGTASSSLNVSFNSSNPAVATIVNNMVTIVGAGTTTITAIQNGNENYNAATGVQRELIVNSINSVIQKTFNIASIIYPNPIMDVVKIIPAQLFNGNLNLNIYDLQGINVYSIPLMEAKVSYEIDISFLKTGAYYLEMSNGTQVLKEKIIKK
jgi:sugar lactone lactonase YvrE